MVGISMALSITHESSPSFAFFFDLIDAFSVGRAAVVFSRGSNRVIGGI